MKYRSDLVPFKQSYTYTAPIADEDLMEHDRKKHMPHEERETMMVLQR